MKDCFLGWKGAQQFFLHWHHTGTKCGRMRREEKNKKTEKKNPLNKGCEKDIFLSSKIT